MGKITQTKIIESKQAIWEFNPQLPENSILGGIDVIAAIRTLAVKVSLDASVIVFSMPAVSTYGVTRHRPASLTYISLGRGHSSMTRPSTSQILPVLCSVCVVRALY